MSVVVLLRPAARARRRRAPAHFAQLAAQDEGERIARLGAHAGKNVIIVGDGDISFSLFL